MERETAQQCTLGWARGVAESSVVLHEYVCEQIGRAYGIWWFCGWSELVLFLFFSGTKLS